MCVSLSFWRAKIALGEKRTKFIREKPADRAATTCLFQSLPKGTLKLRPTFCQMLILPIPQGFRMAFSFLFA